MVPPNDDEPCVVASPEALAAQADEPRCDACGTVLPPATEDDDDGFDLPGTGVYMWTRGDEPRFEKVPLCASCASAIGVTAMARWEIEEEEG
jgi:hypothetical protein